MGSESFHLESNSSKSDYSSSNSGSEEGKLGEMIFSDENKNTLIKRVWIAKRSITLSDGHVNLFNFKLSIIDMFNIYNKKLKNIKLIEPKQNIFEIKSGSNLYFKHWAIILELSNGSYVNIQSGRKGLSLKEFIKTEIEGESVLNAIKETWGEEGHPYSFCYLGNANYYYDNLKIILSSLKNREIITYAKEGKTYYNIVHYNCQHLACDIEKILFGYIKAWHSFKYYINKFFAKFFPLINIDKLKEKYQQEIKEKNLELFKSNVKTMKEEYNKIQKIPNIYIKQDFQVFFEDNKKKLQKLFSLKYEDFANN